MPAQVIVLDSFPLSLVTQRPGPPVADACRRWLATRRGTGIPFILPEIVDYELRRELLRAGKADSIRRLDGLVSSGVVELIRLNSTALRKAAELWATARKSGAPTAAPHALDVDVILCAQVISAGLDPTHVIVATSNAGHISQFFTAAAWDAI